MNGKRIGIDRRGSFYLAAESDFDGGRPRVTAFHRQEVSPATEPFWKEGDESELVLAVPDDLAIVKSINPGTGEFPSVDERLRFELSQSLLEDEALFEFGFEDTGDQHRYLGIAFRQEVLRRLRQSYGFETDPDDRRLAFRIRSLALGRGYLSFCRKETGELLCLVDVTEDAASICLVFQGRIVDLASLHLGPAESTPDPAERLAVDLKTVVNFRLASLMDCGICVPISNLILSGEAADDSLVKTLHDYFRVVVTRPVFNEGYMSEIESEPVDDVTCFLVALGLTVN